MTARVLAWSPEVPGTFPADDEPDLTWKDAAACQYTDAEAFFPEKGGSVRAAKAVCRGCDVRAQCLEYALENSIREGIWGGLSERERRRVNPLAGRPAGVAIAESDERARRSLGRAAAKNVRRLAAERRHRDEARGTEGIAA